MKRAAAQHARGRGPGGGALCTRNVLLRCWRSLKHANNDSATSIAQCHIWLLSFSQTSLIASHAGSAPSARSFIISVYT